MDFTFKEAEKKKTKRKSIKELTMVIFVRSFSFLPYFFFLVVSNFLQWTCISFIMKERKNTLFNKTNPLIVRINTRQLKGEGMGGRGGGEEAGERNH